MATENKDKLKKTRTPGVYQRTGGTYVIAYRDGAGKQRRESAPTYDAARALKSKRAAEVRAGEFHEQTRQTFADYALEWVDTYQGTGRRGFREGTRDDYKRLLEQYAVPFFGTRKLGQITPTHIRDYLAWVADPKIQGRELSDATIKTALNPVRSCFGTAVRDGLIRHNPAAHAVLPHRDRIEDEDEEQVRAMSRDQLATFLTVVPERYRLMFRLLAATGLRRGELIALQWRHLQLDGSDPHVKVRRQIYRGREQTPKGQKKRDVPLPPALVDELRAWHKQTEWQRPDDLVFPSPKGEDVSPSNIHSRVLKPAAQEAGVPWAGFHTFRHTCASLLFDQGRNIKQVQHWLGHSDPGFTLKTYVHLLPGEQTAPLDIDAELRPSSRVLHGDNRAVTSAPFGTADVGHPIIPTAEDSSATPNPA